MATLTIRNVPDEVHRALRVRAAQHGQSAEAELREILNDVLIGDQPVKIGSLLGEIAQEAQLTDEDIAVIDGARYKTPLNPIPFE